MAHKNGLNRKEQIQCAKWLKEGIPAADLAKKFHTSVSVVKKFTQEKLDEAAKKARDRASKQGKISQNQKAKAAVLTEAIKISKSDSEFT